MKIYSTDEVAKILELSSSRIRKAAAALKIGQKVGRGWIFTPEDIEKIRGRIGMRGRPVPFRGYPKG